jgi:hypothetical protein
MHTEGNVFAEKVFISEVHFCTGKFLNGCSRLLLVEGEFTPIFHRLE